MPQRYSCIRLDYYLPGLGTVCHTLTDDGRLFAATSRPMEFACVSDALVYGRQHCGQVRKHSQWFVQGPRGGYYPFEPVGE